MLYIIILWATGFLQTTIGMLAPTILLKIPILIHILLTNIWTTTQLASLVPYLLIVHLASFAGATVTAVTNLLTLIDLIPGISAGTTSPLELLFVSIILFVSVIVAAALLVTLFTLVAYLAGFNRLVLYKRGISASLAYEDEVYAQGGI